MVIAIFFKMRFSNETDRGNSSSSQRFAHLNERLQIFNVFWEKIILLFGHTHTNRFPKNKQLSDF